MQARHKTRTQTGASQGLPGWAMLVIGLIIGLFVAFLVYLDDLDAPPSAAVESREDADPDRSVAGTEDSDDDKPRFEFYSILPDLEVIVPDAPPAEGVTGEEGTEDTISTDIDPEGSYFLQVGSFQKAEQADRMKAQVLLLGLDVGIQTVEVSGERWHRVRIGPYADQAKLAAAQRRLRENDIDYLVLRQKSGG
ncbi:MAG: SPOR domain-containing protein [Halofilum sp. (in: g-proteobacteria)]|nr:SPOR domain-containing protein [Halofilum sp. (in: g-proteobacteria)]